MALRAWTRLRVPQLEALTVLRYVFYIPQIRTMGRENL